MNGIMDGIESRWSRCVIIAALVVSALLPSIGARAQVHGDPIRMIVGWPPGGASDTEARIIADAMSAALGRPIVVDNHPGAGGNIGTELAAHAKPDGNTIMLATGASHGINPALYRHLNYDPIKDFTPVGMISSSPSVLVVAQASPFRSVADLLAFARTHPGKLNYGSAGNGSSGHMAGALFQQLGGFQATHVPYKGGAPAMNDLMGGQIDFMLDSGAMPLIKSGKLRALAVAAPARLAELPSVPTFAEAGVPGFETNWWYGIVAPAGTPRAVLEQLHAGLEQALESSEVRRRLGQLGGTADPGSIDGFWSYVQTQMPKAALLVKASGAQLD